jgi:hypothetical protein
LRSIPAKEADGRSQQEPTERADGRSQQKPTVDPSKSRRLIPTGYNPPHSISIITFNTLFHSSLILPIFGMAPTCSPGFASGMETLLETALLMMDIYPGVRR